MNDCFANAEQSPSEAETFLKYPMHYFASIKKRETNSRHQHLLIVLIYMSETADLDSMNFISTL
jgi:hypothetical protein